MATTKQFRAIGGVSLLKLMLAHYDRYDESIGLRTCRLVGSYVNEKGHAEPEFRLTFEVTGSDLIDSERPCPIRPTVKMLARSWWVRGRTLTGEKVEGYYSPRNQVCILDVEQRKEH